ncbi:hypothetical protein CYLTODRAFT_495459 [Cylindrobasidium torrendii FP15055 ss-10]|uniref:CxC2-like cysteine cluster KDZ transposase-associated domain-containing protein n=1 Tax=Cylindrobasidium torrendii FP15055 ss-10 TaxID=1314674 RepID=A0A0D7ASZ4_9AGAR|nr:hypothetical protein CYLTODRAFT_495459 [Cylindrobasidium torrendii FP15055 ss-10]
MGLIVQLGHGGFPCASPRPPRLVTVVDLQGIHTLDMQFCSCEIGQGIQDWQQMYRDGYYPSTTQAPQSCATFSTLDFFRMLKTTAAISSNRFIHCLAELSNPWGVESLPDREQEITRMERQWAFLDRMQRSGVIFDSNVDDARWGAAAAVCRACPHPDINLPPGWREAPPSEKWLYRPIRSIDANFKMKQREQKHVNHEDLPLAAGLGVQPPLSLMDPWIEEDVSETTKSENCATFAALLQKETRSQVGLKYAGLVGVFCARHEIILGTCNLPNGEKFRHVDLAIAWAMKHCSYEEEALTYDIACQFKKHFRERFEKLPEELRRLVNLPDQILFALPVWHGNVHEPDCEAEHSCKCQPKMGKTDGEGPERFWAMLNRFAGLLREQGDGTRFDELEDIFDRLNFLKAVSLGQLLFRRLKIAVIELDAQTGAFDAINASLPAATLEDWTLRIERWESDRSLRNPYVMAGERALSEAVVRRDLKRQEDRDGDADELEDESDDDSPPAVSASAFIIMGLDIEDAARRLRYDKAHSSSFTPAAEGKILDRQYSISRRLKVFYKHARQFIDRFDLLVTEDEKERRAQSLGPPDPEAQLVYLPLNSPNHCSEELAAIEAQLRRAQCNDTLALIRKRLLARRQFQTMRNKHLSGQKAMTRAATLVQSLNNKIVDLSCKYNECYTSYVWLVGEEAALPLRRLAQEDVQVYGVEESDAEAVKNLNRLDSRDPRTTASRRKANARKGNTNRRDPPGQSTAVMNWLWVGGAVPSANDDALMHESIREEWSKARARKERWSEEVTLLKEEMRRVLASLEHERKQWETRAQEQHADLTADVLAGRSAYALKQASARTALAEAFRALWLRTTPPRGKRWDEADSLHLHHIQVALGEDIPV